MQVYIIYVLIILWVYYRLKVIKYNHPIYPTTTSTKTKQQIIGDIGEMKVANVLRKLGDEYIIEDSINKEFGIRIGSSQIDHIVRYPKNKVVFVIETKNWAGNITGHANDNNWKQDLHGEIHWFYNPIKQNNGHCNLIVKKYPNYRVESIIVFVNDNVSISCKSKKIIKLNQLLDYIKNKSVIN